MSYVLFNHHPQDGEVARYLAADVERHGVPVRLGSGGPGDEQLLTGAAAVVEVISPAMLAYAGEHARRALASGKALYAVRLSPDLGAPPPPLDQARMWADAFGPDAQRNVAALAAELRLLQARNPAGAYPTPHHAPPHGPGPGGAGRRSNPAVPILIGLAGLVAIGVGTWQLIESGVFGGSRSSSDRVDINVSSGKPDISSTTWQVSFTAGGVTYSGQFEPVAGSGPMKITYTLPDAGLTRVVQDCTMTGTQTIRITCRNPRVLTGERSYDPDNFQVTRVSDDELRGTLSSVNTASAPALFTRGSSPTFAEAIWNSAGTPSLQSGATGGSGGDLAAQLAVAADAQRRQLPIRTGPATITAVEAVGTTLNLYITVSQDLGAAQWSALEQSLRANVCQGSSGDMIRQGAAVTYRMLDSAEEQRTVTVTSC